ncbi:hypothetical protein SDRG_06882 [Saprolegnia diclina VS20]|uniref:Roadblock/LAMTOR2 domain-containing protein n=1 Tax=Saprolegnia diclina (strain VS20) TaxID=1156394 RepID=T0QCI1_SAPDV|nr:hypothetical protein SDRG_06882 [Saprolegnia diclina VS20]EQC35594.1 hypothetical protein SDRG_06882 [Saprolegnia diclina VS20]|eukprot:XP_008610911.1 hypothetical protein SDRG_06882 [Saprolegnia diclina VS20]
MDIVGRCFCCATRRRTERRRRLLVATLDRVADVYPGTSYLCLLDDAGEIIAQTTGHGHAASMNPDELATVITTLRRSVALFASTLNHNETQAVHIKGENHIFSCYGLETHVLAFYSVMASVDVEAFDCSRADKRLDDVCRELQRIATTTAI